MPEIVEYFCSYSICVGQKKNSTYPLSGSTAIALGRPKFFQKEKLCDLQYMYTVVPSKLSQVYQRPSRGADPGDIRGDRTGFDDLCRQFLAREGGIGPLLHF